MSSSRPFPLLLHSEPPAARALRARLNAIDVEVRVPARPAAEPAPQGRADAHPAAVFDTAPPTANADVARVAPAQEHARPLQPLALAVRTLQDAPWGVDLRLALRDAIVDGTNPFDTLSPVSHARRSSTRALQALAREANGAAAAIAGFGPAHAEAWDHAGGQAIDALAVLTAGAGQALGVIGQNVAALRAAAGIRALVEEPTPSGDPRVTGGALLRAAGPLQHDHERVVRHLDAELRALPQTRGRDPEVVEAELRGPQQTPFFLPMDGSPTAPPSTEALVAAAAALADAVVLLEVPGADFAAIARAPRPERAPSFGTETDPAALEALQAAERVLACVLPAFDAAVARVDEKAAIIDTQLAAYRSVRDLVTGRIDLALARAPQHLAPALRARLVQLQTEAAQLGTSETAFDFGTPPFGAQAATAGDVAAALHGLRPVLAEHVHRVQRNVGSARLALSREAAFHAGKHNIYAAAHDARRTRASALVARVDALIAKLCAPDAHDAAAFISKNPHARLLYDISRVDRDPVTDVPVDAHLRLPFTDDERARLALAVRALDAARRAAASDAAPADVARFHDLRVALLGPAHLATQCEQLREALSAQLPKATELLAATTEVEERLVAAYAPPTPAQAALYSNRFYRCTNAVSALRAQAEALCALSDDTGPASRAAVDALATQCNALMTPTELAADVALWRKRPASVPSREETFRAVFDACCADVAASDGTDLPALARTHTDTLRALSSHLATGPDASTLMRVVQLITALTAAKMNDRSAFEHARTTLQRQS